MATILIVDDEKNIRNHLASYVQHLGHTAKTAPDADTAWEVLRGTPVDIVLSDVRMAGTDGLALLRQIHALQPDVAVVLMTAYATVPQAVEAIRAGAAEYLMKPFAPDDVRLLINHILDVQALRRETAGTRQSPQHAAPGAAQSAELPVAEPRSLKDLERHRIEQVLAESPSLGAAAARLGIDPATLWRKRKRYGIR